MKITIKNLQKKIPIYPIRIKKTIHKLLLQERKQKPGEISFYFVSDRKIRELNNRFLRKNEPTDVLTFNLSRSGDSGMVADIFISAETALANSKIFRTTPNYEINLYVIHGVLHLLGYDDLSAKERKIMRKKEQEYVHS